MVPFYRPLIPYHNWFRGPQHLEGEPFVYLVYTNTIRGVQLARGGTKAFPFRLNSIRKSFTPL